MTEAEWLTGDDPVAMLANLEKIASKRKIRLFACGCCLAAWNNDWPRRCLQAAQTAERFADGLATEKELEVSRSLACQSAQNEYIRSQRLTQRSEALFFLHLASDAAAPEWQIVFSMTKGGTVATFRNDERAKAAAPDLLRCIFGNPFRPLVFDARWRTTDVLGLARAIYEDRSFDRMPLLADALMDAGYDQEDILAHCRSGGAHGRGCWVVDLVLGKE